MNSYGAELLTCLLVLAAPAPAENDALPPVAPPAETAPAAAEPSLKELVADLSNDRFAVREAASTTLWERGDDAIGQLQAAAAGTDPEAAHRAREILRKFDLAITPGTDPEVIRLVERYQQAAFSEKGELLNEMRERRAYRQLLKLSASEKDPRLQPTLQRLVDGLAVLAARECLLAGDAVEARRLLEIPPANASTLSALAAFHRGQGTLEAELERAKTNTANTGPAWRLALYRAAGRLPEARAAAVEAGEPTLAAVMALLAGDPVPWLELGAAENAKLGPDLYSPLALKRWNGAVLGKDDLKTLLESLSSRKQDIQRYSADALFLLGEPAAALPTLVKLSRLEAFSFFQSTEQLPEALTALKLDPKTPDYTAWAATRFKRIEASPADCDTARSELILLGGFLESRGLDRELADAFDKPLAALAEQAGGGFEALVSDMLGGRFLQLQVCGPLLRVGPQWAGDQDERWEKLLNAMFGNEEVMPAWHWLAQLKPDATRAQRLQAIVAIAGYGADPDHLREQWLALAWAAVTKAEPAQRPELLKHLTALIAEAGDLAGSLKIHDLSPAKEGAELDQMLLLLLTGAGRWEEAAKIILAVMANPNGPANSHPDLHAFAAGCLRRAGHEEQAAAQDAWAEKLALGDAVRYWMIGMRYSLCGDNERCARWWQRAASEIAPSFNAFDTILENHATELLNARQWPQAAAVSEALAQITCRTDHGVGQQTELLQLRLQADLARALSLLDQDRPRALAMLEHCHSGLQCDGLLADHFFPALRAAGLIEQHDRWFEITWQRLQEVIKSHPGSHNTRNSAAWLAARSLRHLDEAEVHLKQALASHPRQAAYLDTMAELQFARGRRNEALEWSAKSLNATPAESAIRRQHERFTNDPLPQ